jgi:hypothetical protein
VIGVQDNAADELRRVRARRPHDAAERRDRRAQLGRVGSRERNARDEMRRLRGEARRFQYGGGIGRQMGGIDSLPRPLTGLSSMMQQQPQQLQDYSSRLRQGRVPPMQPPRGMNDYQRMGLEPFQGGRMASNPVGQRLMPGQGFIPPGPRQAMDFSGSPLLQQQLQKRLAAQQATGPTGPTFAMPRPGEPPRTLQPLPAIGPQQFRPPRPSSSPARVSQQIAASEAASRRRFPQSQISTMPSAAGIQRGAGPRPWFPSTQRPEYLPDSQAQFVPWARGGRVGLKTGGRIPRKKGAKFI